MRVEQALPSDDELRVTGYGGHAADRTVSRVDGRGATSSGGVVNLDRDYGGLGARLILHGELAGGPLTVLGRRRRRSHARETPGLRQQLRRAGRAAPRRGRHASPAPMPTPSASGTRCRALSLTLGVRTSRVQLRIRRSLHRRRRIPTTAARARIPTRARSPAWSGMRATPQRVCELRPGLRDADVRRARVSPGRPGPQFRARSGHVDVGRARPQVAADAEPAHQSRRLRGRHQARRSWSTPRPAAARRIATRARRGAAGSRRSGMRDLGDGFTAHVNYSWLQAEFAEGFFTGSPPVAVPAGARLPGVPPQQAFGVLTWTPGGYLRIQCGRRSPVRGTHLRQRSQHRLRAGVHDRQRARRLRAGDGQRANRPSTCASTTSPT